MKLMISEVLQKAHNAKTKAAKIKILKENNTPALRMIFVANFDDSLTTRLPPGEDIPYRKNEAPIGTEHTLLEKEASKLYYYFKGGADNLSSMKIENMFIRLLEGLHETEAEVVVKAINKTLHKKYRITKAVVTEAFPSIKWGIRSRD
jgi:Fe-S oxidoreductase